MQQPQVSSRSHVTDCSELAIPPTHETHRPYAADTSRYESTQYRRSGRSGLLLPPLSLGLWWNFGDNRPFESQREVLRHAFDHGVCHFDLANNYGPPYGSAEENFGRMMRGDFRPYRNELLISSKAGYDMWPGPYGNFGSRKYIIGSAEEALTRMSLDYVDIFYSHRPDPDTPLEETIGALDTLVRQGKTIYVGISSYTPEQTEQAAALAERMGTPLVIHQPRYSLLDRTPENGLLEVLSDRGLGSIAFSPLAQGLLTDKYLSNAGALPSGGRTSVQAQITEENLETVAALAQIAKDRRQSLAQMSLSWLLRDGGVTSVLVGASSTRQLDENLQAASCTDFTPDELDLIDSLTL